MISKEDFDKAWTEATATALNHDEFKEMIRRASWRASAGPALLEACVSAAAALSPAKNPHAWANVRDAIKKAKENA